jgi:hypothetical protein
MWVTIPCAGETSYLVALESWENLGAHASSFLFCEWGKCLACLKDRQNVSYSCVQAMWAALVNCSPGNYWTDFPPKVGKLFYVDRTSGVPFT